MLHLMVPVGSNPLATTTYRNMSEVRALFGQLCAAVSHPAPGCELVSVTAAGKTLSTMVYGPAAAAAPHLATDLDALMGWPKPGEMQPQGGINPGGPDKPAE